MKKLMLAIAILGATASGYASAAAATGACRNPLDCAPPIQVHDCPLGTPWSTADNRISYCETSAVAPLAPGYDLNSATHITPVPVPFLRNYTATPEPIVIPLLSVTTVVAAPAPIPAPAAVAVPISVTSGATSGVVAVDSTTIAAWQATNAAAAATTTTSAPIVDPLLASSGSGTSAPAATTPYITSTISMPVSNSATGTVATATNQNFYFAELSGSGGYVPPGPCNQYGCGGTIPLSYMVVGNDVVFFLPQ